ncbi:MAG TPA: TM2 domain-containing protein [Hanamia sp.]|jgi:TM2 domain-containing membrane protein YozV|nr:TM2 domain-containing protein [Hanamia sp.]
MQFDNSLNSINPVILKYLYDTTPEELVTINSRTKDFSDEQLAQFCMIYRSKRKDPQLILILCLLGLVGVAGVQRFIIGHIGMGILYFFTAGLCFVGTIIDAINHKDLALEFNAKMITETLSMLNMIRR